VLTALADPNVLQQLQAQSGVPSAPQMPPAQLAAFYSAEIARYRQAIQKAKLQPA